MILLWFIFGCSNKGATCQSEVSVALMDCVQSVSNDIRQCYEEGGTDCTDADFSEILEPLASAAVDSCETPLFGLEQESFVERVEKTCVSDAQSLSWRVFGGPQAAVWNETDSENHSCLSSAHEIGVTYSYDRFTTMNDCLAGECSQQSINPSLTSLRGCTARASTANKTTPTKPRFLSALGCPYASGTCSCVQHRSFRLFDTYPCAGTWCNPPSPTH